MKKHSFFLDQLTLKNFATFENQTIDFKNNFNAIAGETGSGKSLILDAFQLLLGARADRKIVRKNCDFAVIEGSFLINLSAENKLFFENIGYPLDEDNLVIKRIIHSTGNNKTFINDLSCSLSTLGHIASHFIDLVGQYENQKLLSSEYQLELLDQYAGHNDLIATYTTQYSKLSKLRSIHQDLVSKNKDKDNRMDYLKFQIDQLSELQPSTDKENILIAQKNELSNFEKRSQVISQLENLIDGDADQSIQALFNSFYKISSKNAKLFNDNFLEKLDLVKTSLEELSFDIQSYLNDEFDNELFDDVINQLDLYQKLKRKFNCSTEELEVIYTDLVSEYSSLQELESQFKISEENIKLTEDNCLSLANQIHISRESFAKKLEAELTKSIRFLNMDGAEFKISLSKSEHLGERGISIVNFNSQTNPGEGFFKLSDIASGGELSRILLVLRQILSQNDSISIFFFDEIETGIGGETAKKIAQSLKTVSKSSQVIAITHLAQVANLCDNLIFVSKSTDLTDRRTRSFVKNVVDKDRDDVVQTLAGL